MSKSFITLNNVSICLRDKVIIQSANWEIKEGQQWVVLGPNGSGKSTLVRALFGGVGIQGGNIRFHFEKDPAHAEHPAFMKEKIGYVSFELHQKLMEQEDFQQFIREYKGALDEEYTSARDVVMSGILQGRDRNFSAPTENEFEHIRQIAEHLGISYLLDRNITALSTGEMRKTLIARALMKEPRLLILDEPFDGLDEVSRESLGEMIDSLLLNVGAGLASAHLGARVNLAPTHRLQIILITHRLEEIPPSITHVLMLKEGKVIHEGKKEDVLTDKNVSELYGCALNVNHDEHRNYYSLEYEIKHATRIDTSELYRRSDASYVSEILIEMRDVRVAYGDSETLAGVTWMMHKGENWCILGPNGSGKSTIVKLILGENVQGYAKSIWLFGKTKGTGESMWDIKKHIGIVSGELQVQYRKNMSALDVVASGFYDSIGLYQYPTKEQEHLVRQWVEILGIKELIEQNFHRLSYGQRRMVLLARAMVKSPVLLILDEPCHGLDIPNRKRVLEIVETIGDATPTNLLYITHHREEILPCITHVMQLEKGQVLGQGKKESILNV